MENISKIVPQELIWAETTSDLSLMFSQKTNLSASSPYGRMSDLEFAEDRKKRTLANIEGWFGWDRSYPAILAARIAKKTGYETTTKDMNLLMTTEDAKYIRSTIQAAIDIFLKNVVVSDAAKTLGRKGGLVKSERKAKSSAANGLKGGRPKKEKPEPNRI